jgi:hypothetical protein
MERREKKSIRKMHSWNSSRLHDRAECAMLERDGKLFIIVLVCEKRDGVILEL